MVPTLVAMVLLHQQEPVLSSDAPDHWGDGIVWHTAHNMSLRGGQQSPPLTPTSRSPPRRGEEFSLERNRAPNQQVVGGKNLPKRDLSDVEIWAKLIEAGPGGDVIVTNYSLTARKSETVGNIKKKMEHLTGLKSDHQRVRTPNSQPQTLSPECDSRIVKSR